MSEPFIAEIRIFAGTFAPRGWSFCNGQLLPIAQNTALFAIIGTIYGGDGRTTTALPNLQGRAPMGEGRGPGLTSRRIGQSGGATTATIGLSQLPLHTHPLSASSDPPDTNSPANAYTATSPKYRFGAPQTMTDMSSETITSTGGGQAHNNIQPYLSVNFIIALQGLFPPRS